MAIKNIKKNENNIEAAIEIFDEFCFNNEKKLSFIKDVLENDGAAHMDYDFDKLKKIMSLVNDAFSIEKERLEFRKNLNEIATCDEVDDIMVLFSNNPHAIDLFAIAFLTIKQYFEFNDEERENLVKVYNKIGKLIVDHIFNK